MKIFKYIIDNYVNHVIVAILASTIIAVASKFYTGKWLEWFGLVPLWKIIIFGILIFLLFIIIFIAKRIKHLKDRFPIASSHTAPYGWIQLENIEYNEVLWKVRSPKNDPFGSFSKSIIEVETPPRCPNCETELEQSHSFWGGYIWKCVMCNFKKRNSESYYREEKRVEKIAKRFMELHDNET